MTERQRLRPGRRGKWLIAAGVALCALAAAELAARHRLRYSFVPGERWGTSWRVLTRFDPELGWANESGARGNVVSAERKYLATINALGFRDPPREVKKRGGAKRVLFLGDGVTWGQGVGDGDRFSDLLEFEFEGRLECFNAAVPGYSTDQEWWTLAARGDALEPDMVVLVFVLDDVVGSAELEHQGMAKPRFVLQQGTWNTEGLPVKDERGAWFRRLGPRLAELGAHSALWTGWRRWREGAPHNPELEPQGRPYKAPFAERVRVAAQSLLAEDSPARHALSLARSWCARRKIPFVVVALPHGHDQYLYEPLNERPEFDGTTAVTKAVVRVGEELGFAVLDIDAAMFRDSGDGFRLHAGDGYLNFRGHELVSDALRPVVESWLFPPR